MSDLRLPIEKGDSPFRENCMTLLLVEQNLDLVLQSAQRCIVLSNGRLVHAGIVEPQSGDTGEHPLARYLSPAADNAPEFHHENVQ